ncbi:MAG: serine hydrolase domain-containing protein [Acidimicrobiales bacterium]
MAHQQDLVPLPSTPTGSPSPTLSWERANPPRTWPLGRLLEPLFVDQEIYGRTWAVAVAHRGKLVFERYSGQLDSWSGPGEAVGPDTLLLSWSVAKSVLHAAVGILVGEGRLALSDTSMHPDWRGDGDPRGQISLADLLAMRDGLDFVEDYDVESSRSDVIEMLFGGVDDVAAYAASKPLIAQPGDRYSYSSGTSNIISGAVAHVVGGGDAYRDWLAIHLFGPIGMTTAKPDFDGAGTWVASSYLRATALDWLRFGELYLRDGIWDGCRILPEGWVDLGRTALSQTDEDDRTFYGHHWWCDPSDPTGTFWADGYEGQTVTVSPGLDLVVARFGKTPPGSEAISQWRRNLVRGLADLPL